MAWYVNDRPGERCRCGKVSFDKKGAQTQRNWLQRRGREKALRIYQCPESNLFHLTSLRAYRKPLGRNQWDRVKERRNNDYA